MNWAALVLLLSLLACAGGDPFSSGVASAMLPIQRVSPPAFDRLGCTGIRISLAVRGEDYRAQSETADRWCGPVAVDVDSVRVEPASSGLALKLEVTLRNHSGLVFTNVHVLAWDDSLSISGVAADSRHRVRWDDSNTIVHRLPERAGPPPSAAWRFGHIPAAAEESSGPYSINLEVLTTAGDATSLMLILHVAGELVPGQVPPRAPRYIPEDLMATLDPRWGIPPDLLSVIFVEGATVASRRRAIESVKGSVIGGISYPGMRVEGAYLVRIEDGTVDRVFQAVDLLESLPDVLTAGPVVPVATDSVGA